MSALSQLCQGRYNRTPDRRNGIFLSIAATSGLRTGATSGIGIGLNAMPLLSTDLWGSWVGLNFPRIRMVLGFCKEVYSNLFYQKLAAPHISTPGVSGR